MEALIPKVAAMVLICLLGPTNFLDIKSTLTYRLFYLALLINLDGRP